MVRSSQAVRVEVNEYLRSSLFLRRQSLSIGGKCIKMKIYRQ